MIEALGSWWSQSLALKSDALHVFVDLLSIVVSIYVANRALALALGEDHPRIRRIRGNGGYVNAILLALIGCWILFECAERMFAPRQVFTFSMILAAVIGAYLNYRSHKVLARLGHGHSHITNKALDLHVLSDLWQSVAVIAAALAIWLTGEVLFDLLISAAVAFWMFLQARNLWKSSKKYSQ